MQNSSEKSWKAVIMKKLMYTYKNSKPWENLIQDKHF